MEEKATVSEEELEEFREKIYSKIYKYQKNPNLVINNFYTILTIAIVCVAIIWYINGR